MVLIIFDKATKGFKISYLSLSIERKMINNKGKHKNEIEEYQDKLWYGISWTGDAFKINQIRIISYTIKRKVLKENFFIKRSLCY